MKKTAIFLVTLILCVSFFIVSEAEEYVEVCGGFHIGMTYEEIVKTAHDVFGINENDIGKDDIGFGISSSDSPLTDPITNRKIDNLSLYTNANGKVKAILVIYSPYNESLYKLSLLPDYEFLCKYISSFCGKGTVENQYVSNAIANRYKGNDDQGVLDGASWRYTTWITRNEMIQVYINNEPYTSWKTSTKDCQQIQIGIADIIEMNN